MGNLAHISVRVAAAAAAAILVFGATGDASAAGHPRLVSVDASKCAMCHAKLTRGFPIVHGAIDRGCASCHQVEVTPEGTTVGLKDSDPALCIECHRDFEAAAAGRLRHMHAPVARTCLQCHLPHAGERADLLKKSETDLCRDCHDLEVIDGAHRVPVVRAKCSGCHDPHGSETPGMLTGSFIHAPFGDGSCEGCHRIGRGTKIRLRVDGPALCYACHSDLEAQFSTGSVHTVVADGKCTACHNPHMGKFSKLLSEKGAALCFSCHEDIRKKVEGPGGHAAAKKGCEGCHDPHRSDHEDQLLDEPTALCLKCHAPENEELRAKHLDADLAGTRCVGCHDPHGSTGKHLVADGSVHAPFLDRCSLCHEGSADRLKEEGRKPLCFGCHSEIEEMIRTAASPHEAIEKGPCTACHNPHASMEPALLKSGGGRVCTACHPNQKPGPGEHSHGAIDWFGCQSCHVPHGGADPKLLKESGNGLCIRCHLAGNPRRGRDGTLELPGGLVVPALKAGQLKMIDLDSTRSRNHPVPNHPVAGRATGKGRSKVPESFGEISCLSCHVPHSARSKQLFAFGATTRYELCSDCHPK